MTQRTTDTLEFRNAKALTAVAIPTARFPQEEEDTWYTDKEVKDPTGIEAAGYRLIVRPLSPIRKTKTGIHLPDQSIDAQKLLMTVGKLISIGPCAWSRDDMRDRAGKRISWASLGDFVIFGKYAGARMIISGCKCLILNDDEILGIIKDKSILRSINPLGA